MADDAPERPHRETRLLLLIVAVSIAVLLLLARLRFPSTGDATAPPVQGPLAGLAGRATFDDLGDALHVLLSRVSPRFVIVSLAPAASEGSARARLELGLRFHNGLALVPLPPGWRPERLTDSADPAEVVAIDSARHLAVVRTPASGDADGLSGDGGFDGLVYVGAFNATPAGVNVEPRFLGRATSIETPPWPAPLYGLPDKGRVTPGTFVFTMSGRLIGLAIEDDDRDVLVPAEVLDAVATTLGSDGTARP